jgi:hypothetical protein
VIFPESQISAQKRDTRAILLKTVLVRVSCIQNTQIRGETIAKVFGKVDTFWTYHGVAAPCHLMVHLLPIFAFFLAVTKRLFRMCQLQGRLEGSDKDTRKIV